MSCVEELADSEDTEGATGIYMYLPTYNMHFNKHSIKHNCATYLPLGLVNPIFVTCSPLPILLNASTLTVYSVLSFRPVKVLLVVLSEEPCMALSKYTLYITDTAPIPPVLDGALQVTISWSHDSDGGDIIKLVGAPGTGYCIYIHSRML